MNGRRTLTCLTLVALREAMSDNLCRCGAYPNILAAVRAVRAATAGRPGPTDDASG